jgi:hypothetical protein
MMYAMLFMASLGELGRSSVVRYSVEGQGRCEEICVQCLVRGDSPEACYENAIFKICCHGNGGKSSGCGCREAL